MADHNISKATKMNEFLYQRIRWTVFASLFIGYASYYFTRKTFTFSIPTIIKELHMKKSNQHKLGIITSSYTVTYGLSKFIGGFLGDRVSSRALFTSGLFLSGVVNIMMGFYTSMWSLTLLWSINGLVQGLGWPPCAALLKQWFKPQEFGTLWSFLTASTNLASSLSPILMSFLLSQYGLHAAFIVPGLAVITVSGLTYMTIYNEPSEIGLHEYQISFEPSVRLAENPERRTTISDVVKSPFLWALSFAYFMSAIVKFGIADWGQLLLIQAKERSQYDAGIAMSMFEAGGLIGCIISGYISDKLVAKYNSSTNASPRMPLVLVYLFGLVAGLHLLRTAVTMGTSKSFVGMVTFAVGFTSCGLINMFGMMAVENSPPGLTSTTHSIVALAASAGASVAGYPLAIFTKYYDWNGMLVVLETISLLTFSVLFCVRNVSREIGSYVKEKSL